MPPPVAVHVNTLSEKTRFHISMQCNGLACFSSFGYLNSTC
jgi:hypothetical protein